MGNNLARPLQSPEVVQQFFSDVLEIDLSDKKTLRKWSSTIDYIADCEGKNKEINKPEKSTLISSEQRNRLFANDNDRWKLRKQIVKELFELKRLSNDDDIKLKKGGTRPKKIVYEKTAFILIGPPASGKSFFSNKIADKYGAYILDSDYAKRKFPEYKNRVSGASVVHEESAFVIFPKNIDGTPPDFEFLFDLCAKNGANMVIPRIGHDHIKIYNMAKTLKERFGYKTHLILISLDRIEATKRVLFRLKSTKRYVPLGLVFDAYGNEPILSYYRLKNHHSSDFTSFGKITTSVPKAMNYKIIDCDKNSPVTIFK